MKVVIELISSKVGSVENVKLGESETSIPWNTDRALQHGGPFLVSAETSHVSLPATAQGGELWPRMYA